ncbi:MAG: hypothetical protein F6K11_25905 [Leptolyngbya sp. SIO3F4]|nr:hypothetical protein [Leptolyngbya sp. SIO3F4]
MTKPIFSRLAVAVFFVSGLGASGQGFDMGFDGGSEGWRTVVDGVMGGRSSGRVTSPTPGTLRFTGDLSLENNGGFSQARTSVDGSDFVGSEGIEIIVRGDGRTYKFDVRLKNVRMMAGAYQQDFKTVDGEWQTIRLPFDDFRLYSFGRLVSNAPQITPANIESIGVTLSDKKPGAFLLELDAVRTYGGNSEPASIIDQNSLASVAGEAGLNTILELVKASGLQLPNEPVTIFAPTDSAFAELPTEQVQSFLKPEGRETLRAILSYHIAPQSLSSAEVLSRRSLATLNGQRVSIEIDGTPSVGEAQFIATDVPFDGGTVHVIDRVILPKLDPIITLAGESEDLSTLAAAINAAGIADQLSSENGPWTVFAPVNSAFESLPSGVVEELLRTQNRQDLIAILGVHVVPGRIYSDELLATGQTQTLFGEAIEFSIDEGSFRVNDAKVIATDIEASNGVVHLIDGVLLPAKQNPPRESRMMASEAAQLCELAINRGAPLFNAGQYAGCASVYELTIESMIMLGSDNLGQKVIDRLELGIAEASSENQWDEKAWAYRRALDDAYAMLTR